MINADVFYNEQFPLSNKYDPIWILDNEMGPHPLWLTEFLIQPYNLKPGMRVLDLGSFEKEWFLHLGQYRARRVLFSSKDGYTLPSGTGCSIPSI